MLTERNCTEKERAVMQVQKWLRGIAKSGTPLPLILPDGFYGEETKEAVRIFQGLREIEQTGVVDYATWLALRDAYEDCHRKNESPAAISPFSCRLKDGKLHIGDCMPLVSIVQAMIEEIREDYDDLTEQERNGVYDEKTASNISVLQKKWGLKTTGELDKDSWNMLAACYNDHVKHE